MQSQNPTNKPRPLSPHIQIYKPQITSMTSILHRVTGAALAIGLLMVVWLLVAVATGPEAYAVFTGFAGSIIGQLFLFGWSVALFYHMSNGIRHLIWDSVHLLELKKAKMAGMTVFGMTVLLTAITWGFALTGGIL